MELSSLLNGQKDDSLTLGDIQKLRARRNITEALDRISSTTNYEYPTNTADTFLYFDNFIQLILFCSAHVDDDPYTAAGSKAIIVNALRSCISGLMRIHNLEWLLECPQHFSTETWNDLNNNTTILVCLYGLVLAALLNTSQLQQPTTGTRHSEGGGPVQGLLCFILSNSPEIMAHLWITCCSTFDEEELQTEISTKVAVNAYMQKMELYLRTQRLSAQAVLSMIKILQTSDINVLNTKIEQELRNALARPPFTKDDMDVGLMYMQNICTAQAGDYVNVAKLYKDYKNNTECRNMIPGSLSNPLFNTELLESIPSDKYMQTEAVRMGIRFWLRQMSDLPPESFDQYLKAAILHHYPTERKTVLDLVIADWTLRDRFNRHLTLILETIAMQIAGSSSSKTEDTQHNSKRKNKKNKNRKQNDNSSLTSTATTNNYNRRNAPYYAFTQMFDIPDEQQYYQQAQKQQSDQQPQGELTFSDTAISYQIRSGALISLTQFTGSSDIQLMNGCCKLLQYMTLSSDNYPNLIHWATDCLKSANTDIITSYTQWLIDSMEKMVTDGAGPKQSQKHYCYQEFFKSLLKTCTEFASVIVPIILESFSEQNLTWLLHQQQDPGCTKIILAYFDDGPQASKDAVVTKLLKTKTKTYVDRLLSFLKEHMSGTDPKQPRSRVWFRNHFLINILNLAGEEDRGGNNVAASIFRQLFKKRSDFEWYFSAPLIPSTQFTLKNVSFAAAHEVHSIMHTGLASLFQGMVQLSDTKKRNIIKSWLELWTTSIDDTHRAFTVPVSWILKCAGLFDQAPVLVKQMIKQLILIGFQHESRSDPLKMPLSQHSGLEFGFMTQSAADRSFLYRMMDLVLLSDTPDSDSLFELILSTTSSKTDITEQMSSTIIHAMVELSEELELEMLANNIPLTPAVRTRLKNGDEPARTKRRKISRRRLRAIMRKHNEELEKYLQDINQHNNSVKAITTLSQRVFNFLLRMLNATSSPSIVDSADNTIKLRDQFQHMLVSNPLYYEPLGKLARLLLEPKDLQEDIQNVMDLSLELLKKQADTDLYEACQKILFKQ